MKRLELNFELSGNLPAVPAERMVGVTVRGVTDGLGRTVFAEVSEGSSVNLILACSRK